MTTASIDRTEVLSRPAERFEAHGNPARGAGKTTEMRAGTAGPGIDLKTAVRRRGLTMKEFAARIGVTPGYLSEIGSWRRKWTARMRDRVEAALDETPERGFVYRRRPPASGESTFIRERAREALQRGPQGRLGQDGRSRHKPERGRKAGWRQPCPPLQHHVRQNNPVSQGDAEAARGPVPAFAPEAVCPRTPRWSTPSAPGTTAGAGSHWSTSSRWAIPPC